MSVPSAVTGTALVSLLSSMLPPVSGSGAT